ncbi:hypothetical protein ACKC5O_02195 [Aeromonas schubertii]
MRSVWMMAVLFSGSVLAQGEGIDACKSDAASQACATYLNGVVDSALMMGDRQARATFGETFGERALSSRVGERIKQTGRSDCRHGRPDPLYLKGVLREEFAAGKVDSTSDMYDILAAEMSCPSRQRAAESKRDVTP